MVSVVVGIALGLAARLVDDVAPRWVGNVGAVWFLAGFLVGRRQRSLRKGATAGALCLLTATLAYYAWRIGIDQTISLRYLTRVGLFWLVTAVVVGVISGIAGAKSHRWSLAWGVAIGVLVGEAVAAALLAQRWEQVALEAAGGVGLFFYSKRPLAKIFSSTVATATLVAIGATIYRVLLR
ncbi:MAG: DUF6518 family protein [Actinomycetota bacterium]|nr:DUF6518 family protein [Actinomycetota bacterium]